MEVGIDPAHASFLHRFLVDPEKEVYGQQFGARAADTDIPVTRLLRDNPVPEIQVELTDYGLRIFALRGLDGDRTHIRVTNLAFPNAIVIPMSNDMIITQWHVPVDDETSYWYAIFSNFRDPVDRRVMREQRLRNCTLPDYRSVKNRDNNWGYDPEEQRTLTYTGMGRDINIHDQWAVESPGPIQDRTTEHLASTDKAIIANRNLLRRAINAVASDETAPCLPDPDGNGFDGLVAIDTVVPTEDWQSHWRRHDQDRRAKSPWAKEPAAKEPVAKEPVAKEPVAKEPGG